MRTQQSPKNYAALAENTLVEHSRSGDADAFAELYRRYLTPVYRFIFRRLGGDVAAAEDLTSQVFLEALNSLAAYRERGQFAAWLFTIARRRLVDCYRKTDRESLDDFTDDLLSISDDLENRDDMDRLKQLLSILDQETRELLELRFSAELSFADMAAVLGRSEGAVKMSFYRALNVIREKWEADDD